MWQGCRCYPEGVCGRGADVILRVCVAGVQMLSYFKKTIFIGIEILQYFATQATTTELSL